MGWRITKTKKGYNVYSNNDNRYLAKNISKTDLINDYGELQKNRGIKEMTQWLKEVDAKHKK